MSLSKVQQDSLYHKLIDLKESLQGESKENHSMSEDTGELSNGVDNHLADHGSIYLDRVTNQTLDGVDQNLLDEVNAALERMDKGTYGICEKTGKEIPYERLEAVPYARMTVEARRETEGDVKTDAPSYEREFHEQVKDLSNKETVDQKKLTNIRNPGSRAGFTIIATGTFICTCFFYSIKNLKIEIKSLTLYKKRK